MKGEGGRAVLSLLLLERRNGMFDNYEDALEWFHTRKGITPKPGIRRMEWMMEKLGHPEKKFNSIHIAGTNGKGSTVAYLTSLFQAAGLIVGSFTSPHIMSFNERISIKGKPVSDEEVVSLVNHILPLYEEISRTELGGLTEFEVVTSMMFLYFASVQPDVVLMEVGLGGLFDSTNVVQPKLSVITTIGLDHIKILGNTIEEIAFQKAGIIKAHTPVILGNIQEKAKKVLVKNAKEKNAEVESYGEDFCAKNNHSGENFHEYFDYCSKDRDITDLEIGLMGQHQIENAVTSVQAFRKFCSLTDFPYTDGQIKQGLYEAFWPVRLEIISQNPFILLDGAHNEPAMEVLLETMKSHFPHQKVKVLFAAITTKELEKIGPLLQQIPHSEIHLTTFDFPKAATLEDLKERLGIAGTIEHSDWRLALTELIKELGKDELLLVTGSLYFLSDVRQYLLYSVNSVAE